ncbi:MAG: hypothetical protein ACLU37_10265 [Collinsella sp.]
MRTATTALLASALPRRPAEGAHRAEPDRRRGHTQAAETTEARTALANKAGKAATKHLHQECKAMLEEMRDYQGGRFLRGVRPERLRCRATTAWSSPSPTPTRPSPTRT